MPRFDLTGVWVSTEAKVGKDAGELAGLDVDDRHRRDQRPGRDHRGQARLHRLLRDGRHPADARRWPTCARLLSAGINVVGSAPGVLQYPWGVMPDKYIRTRRRCCARR